MNYMAKDGVQGKSRILAGLCIVILGLSGYFVGMKDADAIPAFARKYQANCALCHTNEPRLTAFGQQFKANGYQMPGSEDGDSAKKHVFEGAQGPVTLDDISNIMAVRFRGDIIQPSFNQETSAMKANGVTGQADLSTAPTIVNLFFGGTVKKNISYFSEVEYNSQEDTFGFERVFMQFDNVVGQSLANVQVGKFDPSGLFAFPTHRQQMNPIGPEADSSSFPPSIYRIPILPLAFSAKMYGLTRGGGYAGSDGYAILPFEPLLYNTPSQNGIAVFGRPLGFGSPFMYQIGVSQHQRASNNGQSDRYDTYVMGRYDLMSGGNDVQLAAFYYHAPNAAYATLRTPTADVYANNATDINRWGVGARALWGDWDIYGTYISDSISSPTFAAAPLNTSSWDTSGGGVSLEADWRFRPKWMFGMRYDWMSPGGLSRLPVGVDPAQTKLNVDAMFISPMLKYYPHPNIGLYVRAHVNLESNKNLPNGGPFDGSAAPATNLRSIAALGVDMAF